jgi:hypothetical protein
MTEMPFTGGAEMFDGMNPMTAGQRAELESFYSAMQAYGKELDKAQEACGPHVHFESREYKAYGVALAAWEESERVYNSKAVELIPALLAEIDRLTAAAQAARVEAADLAGRLREVTAERDEARADCTKIDGWRLEIEADFRRVVKERDAARALLKRTVENYDGHVIQGSPDGLWDDVRAALAASGESVG